MSKVGGNPSRQDILMSMQEKKTVLFTGGRSGEEKVCWFGF